MRDVEIPLTTNLAPIINLHQGEILIEEECGANSPCKKQFTGLPLKILNFTLGTS